MKCVDRLEKHIEDDLDGIILNIRNGNIKSGRYAHLVKIDKSKRIGKELFKDGNAKDDQTK